MLNTEILRKYGYALEDGIYKCFISSHKLPPLEFIGNYSYRSLHQKFGLGENDFFDYGDIVSCEEDIIKLIKKYNNLWHVETPTYHKRLQM